MTDKEHSRENIPVETASPKTSHKKEKTKYQAFRSDDDSSSEVDETDINAAKFKRKLKKDRSNTFKVKIPKVKSKKKDKEKKKKTKKSVTSGDEDQHESPSHEPVFGVPLEVAVERSGFPDKIELPRIVRECILFVEEKGLDIEGIYRVSGVKSKVDQLKLLYNEGRQVDLSDYDPNTVASVLKLYLRELPSNVLTTRLAPIFDACVGLDDNKQQVQRFQQLINDLPCPNKTVLAWLFTHFAHVMENNMETKMNIQNLSIVFSPTMSISHGVLNIFFINTKEFFPNTELIRYTSPNDQEGGDHDCLPQTIEELQGVLRENENFLSQLHEKVNQGEEQDEALMEKLWERQRRSTQIKRRIKSLKKEEKLQKNHASGVTEHKKDQLEEVDVSKVNSEQQSDVCHYENIQDVDHYENIQNVDHYENIQDACHYENIQDNQHYPEISSSDAEFKSVVLEEQMLIFEQQELLKITKLLQKKIQREKLEIERLNVSLNEYEEKKETSSTSSSSSSSRSSRSSFSDDESSDSEEDNTALELMLEELEMENRNLQLHGDELITKISEERKATVKLQTDIRLLEMELVIK